MPRAALFPTGFATNLGVITTFGGPGVLVCSDELNHASIIDGCRLARGRRRGLPPPRSRPPRARSLRDRGARRALVVTDTVFSMDGDVADVAALVELCAREGALLVVDEAHAVLGPELDVPDDADVLRVGTLSKTLGALGGFVAGPRALDRARREPRPPVHLHDRADAGRHRRRARRAADRALARRRRARRAACARTSTGCAPATRRRSCRSSAATSSARSMPRPRSLDDGLLVPAIRPPTVARRHVAAARHASRPRTPTRRSTTCCARSTAVLGIRARAVTIVAVAGHRHRRRQDVRRRPRCSRRCAPAGTRSRPRKPVQSFAPGDAATDADVLAAATGERRTDVCPPHRWLPLPMAPPMAAEALGLAAVHDRRPRDRGRAPRAPTTRTLLVETAGGVRSPIAADGDCVAPDRRARARRSWCSSPTPGSARSTSSACSVDALAARTASSSTSTASTTLDDLHARNVEWLRTREGLEVVTDIEALADVVEPCCDVAVSCSTATPATAPRSCRRGR